jgi:hypothetical protein
LNIFIYSITIEKVENLLVTIKEIENISPQDGLQMVEVDLILANLLHTIVIIDLHFNIHTFTTFTLILNTPDFVVH